MKKSASKTAKEKKKLEHRSPNKKNLTCQVSN